MSENTQATLPTHCHTVIVGGGIVGASVAYHLARAGIKDVVLFEGGQLTSGTTWHAAGLVAQLRATPNLTRLAAYTRELYQTLENRGEFTGFKETGALTVATCASRVIELKRQATMAQRQGILCQWCEPEEVSARWPDVQCADVEGGLYLPQDGQTGPVETTLALARGAKAAGVLIKEGWRIQRLLKVNGRITGVRTATGATVHAEHVVLCAGLWSRELALTIGVNVPVYPTEHFYAVTEPSMLPPLPILRDPDAGVYLKPDAGRMLVGCFETRAKGIHLDRLSSFAQYTELPFDLEHFAPYLEKALLRIPKLTNIGIRSWFNGPEGFTPDGRYLLGEAPNVRGLFVAAGFNSIGIQSAGGVGDVLTRWIINGRAPMDLWDVDIRRMHPKQNGVDYLHERVQETLGLLYDMHWPYRQYRSARDLRQSPLHEQTTANGACFGELAGWERPNWYAPAGVRPVYQYSYARQNWFDYAAAEHHAVREGVALFDQTSFAKYGIEGADAAKFLNRLCTANVDVAPGKLVYCQWLNEQGGIEADVTVARLDTKRYWVISAAASEVRDLAWLNRHARDGNYRIVINNHTEQYAVLGIMGPQSRSHLGALTSTELANPAFPFATTQTMTVAGIDIRAFRISYVGALGWELYVPWRDAPALYDKLMQGDIVPAGYHAMDSLRLEKAYRHWGYDITDEDTPLEAGLAFTADLQKQGGFIGKEALETQRLVRVNKRLLLFVLDEPDALLYHNETIWCDGQRVGYIRSGGFGYGVDRALGFGYVETTTPTTGNKLLDRTYAIEVAGHRHPATAHLRALYDPENEVMRG